MTDDVVWQNKKTKTTPKVQSLAEKYLEDKKNAALGIAPSHQFGGTNPIANRPWFGWKTWRGRPTIRKHSARSR